MLNKCTQSVFNKMRAHVVWAGKFKESVFSPPLSHAQRCVRLEERVGALRLLALGLSRAQLWPVFLSVAPGAAVAWDFSEFSRRAPDSEVSRHETQPSSGAHGQALS